MTLRGHLPLTTDGRSSGFRRIHEAGKPWPVPKLCLFEGALPKCAFTGSGANAMKNESASLDVDDSQLKQGQQNNGCAKQVPKKDFDRKRAHPLRAFPEKLMGRFTIHLRFPF
jgi:hypothetical protein